MRDFRSKDRKKRFRFFQFSLRTFLILAVVCSIALGLFVASAKRARKQREAVRVIEAQSGKVVYDHETEFDTKLVSRMVMHQPLRGFWVNYFSAAETALTGPLTQDLDPYTELDDLKHLVIGNWGNTNVKDFSPLAKLERLKTLKIFGPNMNDLSPLTELKDLEYLELRRTQVADLSPLASLPKLKALNILSCNRTSDAEINKLKKARPELNIYRN